MPAEGESALGKAAAPFRVAGAFVGNTVAVAKKASGFGATCGRKTEDLCRYTVSSVGQACARLLRARPKPAVKPGPKPAKPQKPSRRAAPTESRAATIPAAQPQTVGQRLGAVAQAQPQPVRTGQESATATARKPLPSKVTPKEVDVCDLGGAAQKLLFRTAVSDLEHPDPATRYQAIKAIARIRHVISVRALSAQFVRETLPQLRKECIEGLAALDMKQGFPTVVHALNDAAVSVRLAAVRGAYRLGGGESGPTLIRMVRDEAPEVRRMAVICIGWLGGERLADELIPLLTDDEVAVRRAAVEAIGNLGARHIASALIECFADADDSVRRKVFDVLETLTGRRMAEEYPEDEQERRRLLARWRHWRQERNHEEMVKPRHA